MIISFQISDLYLNDPACHGTETANLYVFSIKNNFTDCGTQMVIYAQDTAVVMKSSYIV